jgi:hypothetical protein
MKQPSLFQMPSQTTCPHGITGCTRSHGNPAKPRKPSLRSGDELAVLGAESVSKNSDQAEVKAIDSAILVCAARGRAFTADDVRAMIEPSHPNLLGGRFLILARQDKIEPCGYVKAERPARRGGILRVWRKKS